MPLTSLTGALAVALAATALTVPAEPVAAQGSAPQETDLTLITGDRVRYVDGPGEQDVVTVDRRRALRAACGCSRRAETCTSCRTRPCR